MTEQILCPKIYPFTRNLDKRFEDVYVHEFVGPQRSGKTTLEVAIVLLLLIKDIPDKFRRIHPEDTWWNFPVDINGCNCTDTEGLLWVMGKVKDGLWRNKVIIFGESSQKLYARNYKDKLQTEIASSIWQFPKKNCPVYYESNPGSTVDVLIRDGTAFTQTCKYEYDYLPREEQKIHFDVISNYECWVNEDVFFLYPAWIQQFFDSYGAVI